MKLKVYWDIKREVPCYLNADKTLEHPGIDETNETLWLTFGLSTKQNMIEYDFKSKKFIVRPRFIFIGSL